MLIAAAERAGSFIPRFCYHPRMKPVGMCRMCLVEVSGPRGASLQPSCFVEVQAGSTVVTDSPKVKKAQDGVLEFLLINHPLDCPVCDKGGECPFRTRPSPTDRVSHGSSRRSVTSRSRSPSPSWCCSTGSAASNAAAAPASPTRWRGRRRSTSSVGASASRSTPFPSSRSRRTSRAIPSRSARWGRSPRRPTASPPVPGTSTRSSRPAPPARWGAGWRCSRRPTGPPGCSASMPTRSTTGGCATRGDSHSTPSTGTTA